jgi:hypothetical protein
MGQRGRAPNHPRLRDRIDRRRLKQSKHSPSQSHRVCPLFFPVTQEGYRFAFAAKAVDVPYTTHRQWCQKQSARSSPKSDKARLEELVPPAVSWPPNSNASEKRCQANGSSHLPVVAAFSRSNVAVLPLSFDLRDYLDP